MTVKTIAVTYTLQVAVDDRDPCADLNVLAIAAFQRLEKELVPSDTRDVEVIA